MSWRSLHRDPNNPGCKADKDTIREPHTPCYDFQYVSKKGDSFNDQQCSSCRCPQPDYYGIPDCTQVAEDEKGTQVPKGCKEKGVNLVNMLLKDLSLWGHYKTKRMWRM